MSDEPNVGIGVASTDYSAERARIKERCLSFRFRDENIGKFVIKQVINCSCTQSEFLNFCTPNVISLHLR